MPYLALKIHEYNRAETTSENDRIRMQGIMVGNACTHPRECYDPGLAGNSYFVYQYLTERHYYTEREWAEFRTACLYDYKSENCQNAQDKL